MPSFPDRPFVVFAHAAYQLGAEFARRGAGLDFAEVRDLPGLEARVPEADVLVLSGLWRDHLLERGPRLRFVQSASAGTDQYGKAALAAKGVRLASAQGVNERAVAEHAIGLILALHRHIHLARDRQASAEWRPMISDPLAREAELGGRTLLIVGLGRIGARLARLALAFDMRVIGTRRDAAAGGPAGVEVHGQDRLLDLLPRADIVALACPLTPDTERLIDARALAAMKPGASLVNVARGRVVDEPALVHALASGRLKQAALDTTVEEPLPAASPLWRFPNVLITPHSAGETERYEVNVVDLLMENLERLKRGEPLRNAVV
jgi:phosphoglycerate dehydrogenase-like enzyme